LVSGSIFFAPFSAVGQVADDLTKEAMLLGFSLWHQQLRFLCLIP
jgi:hypothetical protein